MNNEPEVIDDIDIESEFSDNEPQPTDERQTSASEEVSEDALDDTQLGQHLGRLITEIRQDEETFQQTSAPGRPAGDETEPDPFDPSHFSLDTPFDSQASEAAAPSAVESQGEDEMSEFVTGAETADRASAGGDDTASTTARADNASGEGEDPSPAIAQLVTEIETALQRFTQSERLRADQLIAEKEAQVAEQYRRLRNLANKLAKQKAQIQEAKKELKAKLEVADRLHIEFDGIRQVLNGKLGVLDQLEKEDEAAE